MRIGKLGAYPNSGAVPLPDDSSYDTLFRLVGADTVYGKKVSGVVYAVGGGGGLAAVNVGLTAFVDSVFGNDGTAVLDKQNLPFLTVDAAVLAASAIPGTVVSINPGSYTVSSTLVYPRGIVYAPAGVTLSGTALITDSLLGLGETFQLIGSAKLISTGNIAINLQGDGDLSLEFDSVTNNGSTTVQYNKTSGNVSIKAREITSTRNSTFYLFGGQSNMNLDVNCDLIGNGATNPFEMMFFLDSFDGNANFNVAKYNSSTAPGRADFGNIYYESGNPSRGTVNLNGILMQDNGAVSRTTLSCSFSLQSSGGDGALNVNLKEYTGPSLAAGAFGTGGKVCTFNIEKAVVLEHVFASNQADDNFVFNGYYESDYSGAGWWGNGVIALNTALNAGAKLRLGNFSLKLFSPSAGIRWNGEVGGALIADNVTVEVAAVTDGVASPLASQMVVNGRFVTNGTITNVTNAVVGTIFITDSNIQL